MKNKRMRTMERERDKDARGREGGVENDIRDRNIQQISPPPIAVAVVFVRGRRAIFYRDAKYRQIFLYPPPDRGRFGISVFLGGFSLGLQFLAGSISFLFLFALFFAVYFGGGQVVRRDAARTSPPPSLP